MLQGLALNYAASLEWSNYYRDMWVRRSHVLAPLAALTSKTTKWKWTEKEQTAFDTAKKIIA